MIAKFIRKPISIMSKIKFTSYYFVITRKDLVITRKDLIISPILYNCGYTCTDFRRQ